MQGCYSGEDTTRYLDIGIATDVSFLEANGGRLQSVLAQVESAVAKTNEVFVAQFNILLRISQVVVTSQRNEAPPLNRCEASIQQSLHRFSLWAGKLPNDGDQSAQPVQQGLWHMFTACYKPPGNIGMAYIQDGNGRLGTLCYHAKESLNVGVTSLTSQTWLTFAHEVGHNFGARHSFENGRGRTGGIMDYNVNGLFNGSIQFNTLRRTEICTEISTALASPLCMRTGVNSESKSKGSEKHIASGSFFTPFHDECSDRESTGSCTRGDGEVGACRNGLCHSLASELVFDGQIVPHKRVCSNKVAASVQRKTLMQAHPKFGCQSMKNWLHQSHGDSLFVLVSAGGSCSLLEKILYAKSAGFTGAVLVQEKGRGLNAAISKCDGSIDSFVSLVVPWNVGQKLEAKLSRGYEVNVMYGPLAGAEALGYILHDPDIHQFVSTKQNTGGDGDNMSLLILIGALSCVAVVAAVHVFFMYGLPGFGSSTNEPVLPLAVRSEGKKQKDKPKEKKRREQEPASKEKGAPDTATAAKKKQHTQAKKSKSKPGEKPAKSGQVQPSGTTPKKDNSARRKAKTVGSKTAVMEKGSGTKVSGMKERRSKVKDVQTQKTSKGASKSQVKSQRKGEVKSKTESSKIIK